MQVAPQPCQAQLSVLALLPTCIMQQAWHGTLAAYAIAHARLCSLVTANEATDLTHHGVSNSVPVLHVQQRASAQNAGEETSRCWHA